MPKILTTIMFALLVTLFLVNTVARAESPYLANGVKIGEVTPNSAIIWVRLTETKNCKPSNFQSPGKNGYASLKTTGPFTGNINVYNHTPVKAKAENDYTIQFKLSKLQPGSEYNFVVTTSNQPQGKPVNTLHGQFKTAPASTDSAKVTFTVTTGHKYKTIDDPGKGQRIYPSMLKLKPDFFVHTGDIVYYDNDTPPLAKSVETARLHWHRMYSLPYQREFHRQVASYFIKDDHDLLRDDCWPGQTYGQLTWEQGLSIFREQVPMGEKTYRTIRWGKDLQIWLVEGRDYRSPNNQPDGPDKTIWGKQQIDWLKKTVTESDATFKVLISPTPIVGPDREKKNDNHANEGFKHEGDMLRKFIASQKNMTVVCGDRHWQYVSVDAKTGVREYCSGPSADKHSGGWKQGNKTSMHQYLRVKGGFLSVTVERIKDKPTIIFRHHDVDGNVKHVETLSRIVSKVSQDVTEVIITS